MQVQAASSTAYHAILPWLAWQLQACVWRMRCALCSVQPGLRMLLHMNIMLRTSSSSEASAAVAPATRSLVSRCVQGLPLPAAAVNLLRRHPATALPVLQDA